MSKKISWLVNYVDFRNDTIRVSFKDQVGLGSCFDVDNITDEVKEIFEVFMYSDEEIKDLCTATDLFNVKVKEVLGNDVEIDWRDSRECEIHNVKFDVYNNKWDEIFK